MDVRVMVLGVGHLANPDRERERAAEVWELELSRDALDSVLLDDLPVRHLIAVDLDLIVIEGRNAAAARDAVRLREPLHEDLLRD
jgi:hypothetical protein